MMPKGWESKTLEDIADFENGQAHETLVDENGPFILVNSKFVSSDGKEFKRVKESLSPLSQGDIALVMSDIPNGKALAKCFLVQKDNIYTLNQRIGKIKANKNIDPSFLRYAINRNSYFLQFDSGVGQTNLRKSEVLECPLLIPPHEEQKKIAEILSTWDRAIAQTEALLVKSKLRYSNLSKKIKRFAEEDAEEFLFDELFEIKIGGTPSRSKPEYWDYKNQESYPWIAISDLKSKYISETSERINNLAVKKSNVKKIVAGTVIMSFKLTIGRKAILKVDSFTNEAIAAFEIKDPQKLLNLYFYHALNWVRLDGEVDEAIKGKTLNKDKLKRLVLIVPPINRQEKIIGLLEDLDLEIEHIGKLLTSLKIQKQGLMQKLLTGKVRVKV